MLEYFYSEVDKKLYVYNDDLKRLSLDLKRAGDQLQRQANRIQELEAALAQKNETIETVITDVISKLSSKLYSDLFEVQKIRSQSQSIGTMIDLLTDAIEVAHHGGVSYTVKKPDETICAGIEQIIYIPPYVKGLHGELTFIVKDIEALTKEQNIMTEISNKLRRRGVSHKVTIQFKDKI